MSDQQNTDDREPTLPAEYFEWLGREREGKSAEGQIRRANILSGAATASRLLKQFSETDGSLPRKDRELFAEAFKQVLTTHKYVEQATSRITTLQERDDGRCTVCYENLADTLLLPCKHLFACMGCYQELMKGREDEWCKVCTSLVSEKGRFKWFADDFRGAIRFTDGDK